MLRCSCRWSALEASAAVVASRRLRPLLRYAAASVVAVVADSRRLVCSVLRVVVIHFGKLALCVACTLFDFSKEFTTCFVSHVYDRSHSCAALQFLPLVSSISPSHTVHAAVSFRLHVSSDIHTVHRALLVYTHCTY